MAYLVLARKWRPRGFDAVTGQEHVTRTLKNAIQQNRVHHAFLFCGARGVGKTSSARLLARALNCQAFDGPTIEPCGECAACKEITAGTSVDVYEIDGASNRGIDSIRDLRDGIAYAPQRDRFKVYIIDEVHMLTVEAFNALLKTLEEPPAHVKFIFATTEPHKLPVTILSRCQRFDFKRIPLGVMAQRLGEILAAEGVEMDEAGLRLVARESEGSMRDALSLLDRVISACGNTASYSDVAAVLGVADRAWLHRLVSAAVSHDIPNALSVVGEAFEYGLDLRRFASDFVHYLRDAAVLQVAGEQAQTDLAPEERKMLLEFGQRVQPEDLQRLVRLWTETAERLVHASFPRLEVEMAAIRMCRLRPVQPIDAMLKRLESIERRLDSGAPLPPLQVMVGHDPKVPAQAESLGAPSFHSAYVNVHPVPLPERAAPPVVLPQPASPALAVAASLTPEVTERAAPVASPVAQAEVAREVRPAAPIVAPSVASPVEPTSQDVSTVTDHSPEVVLSGSFDPALWESWVDGVRSQNAFMASLLDQTRALRLEAGVLNLAVWGDVSERRLHNKHAEILGLLQTQQADLVNLKLTKVTEISQTPLQRRDERKRLELEKRTKDAAEHPIVAEFIASFGASVVSVEPFETLH